MIVKNKDKLGISLNSSYNDIPEELYKILIILCNGFIILA